jgi:hypothetical protein
MAVEQDVTKGTEDWGLNRGFLWSADGILMVAIDQSKDSLLV